MRVNTSQNNILVELLGVGHDKHHKCDYYNSIQIDILPAVPIGEIAKNRGGDQFDDDIEGYNFGVFEILYALTFVNVEFLLEKHGLEGVDADEDEGEHKVVDQASNKIFSGNGLVEMDAVETSFGLEHEIWVYYYYYVCLLNFLCF